MGAGLSGTLIGGLIGALVFALVVAVFAWTFVWFRRREHHAADTPLELSDPLPPQGVRVPIVRSMSGLAGTPFGATENSMNPLLELHRDHLACRVTRRQDVPYDEVAEVDASGDVGPRLTIRFVGGTQFVCWLASTDLAAVVQFLQRRGVRITPRAASLAGVTPWQPPSGASR